MGLPPVLIPKIDWDFPSEAAVLGYPHFFPKHPCKPYNLRGLVHRSYTMWGPQTIAKLVNKSPNNYSYKYHKP